MDEYILEENAVDILLLEEVYELEAVNNWRLEAEAENYFVC